MAYLNTTFTESDFPEDDSGEIKDFPPIPKGLYQLNIDDTILKTKEDDRGEVIGNYLSIKMRVQGPSHSNRVIYDNIYIKHNDNSKELKGRSKLGTLLRSLGIPADRFTDSDQLIGGDVIGDVGESPAKGIYKASNNIWRYKPIGESTPAPAQRQATPAAAPAKAAPPWAKR